MNKLILFFALITLGITSCKSQSKESKKESQNMSQEYTFKVVKSNDEWKNELTPEQYRVLREAGTERPHTGEYNLHFEDGTYKCAACNEPLFDSDSKFESHCGWPSFDNAKDGKIIEKVDRSHGMVSTEILCANCGSHLGHVFNDGPTDTGLRYCVNSVSLDFDEDTSKEEKKDSKKDK